MAGNRSTKTKNKRGWRFYVGAYFSLAAIVMLFSNFLVAVIYGLIAFLLLRKGKPENQKDSEYSASPAPAVPVIEPLPDQDPPADMPTPEIPKPAESKSTQKPTEDFTKKTYIVAGVQYYTDNLMEIAVPNSNYDMTKKEIIDFGMTDQNIWEYEFYPSKLELQPEPDNPHDPNAIKVLIDDKLVGYIKEGSSKHLFNVIDQDRFLGASCKIGGGKYKRVDEEYDYDRDKTTHTLDKGEKNFSIVLTVKEKKKVSKKVSKEKTE